LYLVWLLGEINPVSLTKSPSWKVDKLSKVRSLADSNSVFRISLFKNVKKYRTKNKGIIPAMIKIVPFFNFHSLYFITQFV
jgi:hypothetical protein